MLQMSKLSRKSHKKAWLPDDPVNENKEMLTISKLPRSKSRGRTPLAQQISVVPAPTKILSMSDLPRRKAVARQMSRQAREQAKEQIHRQGVARVERMQPKIFSDHVRNGAWKGRRCFIIGGGPSIKNIDLNLLQNELTIGINRAYELLDPSILFGVDGQMWGWAEQGKLGIESQMKFKEYKGYKVWMALHKMFPSDFYLIEVDDNSGYKIGKTSKLSFKNNGGYGAINLAAALGANPIYLLGYDMAGNKQGKQVWWHDGYPTDYGEGIYENYIKEISNFAPVLKQAGFEVINLNPKSALKCFPFGKYADVVRKKPVVPVGAIQAMEKPGTVTTITPTGDRPLAFALCRHWMEMQTQRPDQWIVVDDGKKPLKPSPDMTYIRRSPRHNDPQHTLSLNLKTALPYVTGSKVVIIEDDEYYAPKYIETMAKELDASEIVGVMRAKYYHLPTGGYVQIPNITHASLAQTGFRSTFLPELRRLVERSKTPYIDMEIWRMVMREERSYLFLDNKESLYVGIKGLPGRSGIGQGHNPAMYGKQIDHGRNVLKSWMPLDYKVYMSIINGELNDANYNTYFPKITGITVCQNTKDLIKRAYESVRKFHPDMPIIIIDGSDAKNPCAHYVKSLASDLTTVVHVGSNIGHGRGMCLGIDYARTPCALVFDSDIEMLKSPVDEMFKMMELDTFGVGYIEHTDYDGFGIGARKNHKGEDMPYLHPYFQLINIHNYRKYHPYVHHGAPCYLTMLDIYKQGVSDRVLKEFPGLGHTAGADYGWVGKSSPWVRHDVKGTRDARVKKGLPQIEQGWVKNKGLV